MKPLNTTSIITLALLLIGSSAATFASTNISYEQLNKFDGKPIKLSNVEKYGRGELVIGYGNCAFVIDGNGDLAEPKSTKNGIRLASDEILIGCLHITYGDAYEMTDLYILDQACVSAKPDVCVEGKSVAIRIRSFADTDTPDADAQLVVERTYQVHAEALEQLGSAVKNGAVSSQASFATARMKTMLVNLTEYVMTKDEFGYRSWTYSASGNLIDRIDAVYPAQYDAIPYNDDTVTTPTMCESVGNSVQAVGEVTGDVSAFFTGLTANIASTAVIYARAGVILKAAGHAAKDVEVGSVGIGAGGGTTIGEGIKLTASWANKQGAAMWGGLAESLCEMFEDELTETPSGPGGLEEINPILDALAAQMCMVCSSYEAVASNPSQTVQDDPVDDHTIVVYGDSITTENVCTAFTIEVGQADSNGFCIEQKIASLVLFSLV